MRGWSIVCGAPAIALVVGQALSACGGGTGAAAPDGGGVESGAADVTTSDVGAGGSLDGGSATDTGSVPQPDVSVGPSFCSTLSPPPTFCSDFDEGPASLGTWNVITSNGYYGKPDGGTVVLDTSTFVSAPASLSEATDPAMADAGEYRALVLKYLGVTASETSLAGDVLVASGDTVAFMDLTFAHPNGTEDDLGLDLVGGTVEQSIPAGDSGASGVDNVMSFTLTEGVPLGAWHRVTLDLVVGPPATLTVSIDSSVVLDAAALDPRFTNGAIEVGFGVVGYANAGVAPSPAQAMHVDNVVVQTKP